MIYILMEFLSKSYGSTIRGPWNFPGQLQIPAFGLLRARRLANPAVNVKDGP